MSDLDDLLGCAHNSFFNDLFCPECGPFSAHRMTTAPGVNGARNAPKAAHDGAASPAEADLRRGRVPSEAGA